MKRKGFTLVELLAVVVILGILITLTVPAVNRAIKHAEKVSLYNYTNRAIQDTAKYWALNGDKTKINNGLDSVDNVLVILSLDMLEIKQNDKYEGYISYNNTTDEFTGYIYDKKNMVSGLTSNDTRKADEIVRKFDDKVIDTEFSPSSICSSQTDTYICLFLTQDGISYDFNYLPGNAVITSFYGLNYEKEDTDFGKIDNYQSLHDLIRQLVKPNTTDPAAGIYAFSEVNIDYNKCLDNIVAVDVVDYDPPSNAVNITPIVKGKTTAELPVYLWYDSPSQTLYFSSSSGYVDIYFVADDLFSYMTNLQRIDFTKFIFHYVISASQMFALCTKLTEIDMSDKIFDLVTYADGMFFDCFAIDNLDFNGWTASYLETGERMFYGCKTLKTVDTARWDLTRMTSLHNMFTHCFSIESIDVSNWDIGKVTDLQSAFQNCFNLKYLNVSRWNTGRVEYISWLFCGDGELDDLDVSNWDTRNLKDCIEAFTGCEKISKVDMSNWDISSITSIWHMFGGCKNIKELKFGRTKNYNKLVRTYRYNENNETTASFIGGCELLEIVDVSNFEKFPNDASYGYSNNNLHTFLVSNSFTGNLDRGTYTITKVG